MTGSIAVSGDAIINRRLSDCADPGFRSLVEVFRDADVGFTHFETLVHDYTGDAVHPAAESGGTWMRSPGYVVEELEWLGIDLVSHASNHALDYGYGALRTTWEAMAERDMPIAGTGENLGEARSPTFFDSSIGRVALVSMATSFTPWSRAGEARYDLRGRPGLNPLGFHHEVDAETLDTIKTTARQLGLWITELDDGEWALNPPGLHNTLTKYYETDDDFQGARMVVDERDREGNLRAVSDAADLADLAIAHIHTHAWDPDGTLADPPEFVQEFARECVDAGADLVVAQGSHAPLRPIEIYEGTPIFYDPGDLIMMSATVTRLPTEFFERFTHNLDEDPRLATQAAAKEARPRGYDGAENPPGGYFDSPFRSRMVVPVCDLGDDFSVERVTLHPGALLKDSRAHWGIPSRSTGDEARDTLEHVAKLSAPFGTDVTVEDDRGIVEP